MGIPLSHPQLCVCVRQEPSKPPFFTRKMQPCRVFDKEGAKFEVEFTGDPAPEVEWFREDFLIQSSQDFKVRIIQSRQDFRMKRTFLDCK